MPTDITYTIVEWESKGSQMKKLSLPLQQVIVYQEN